MIKECLPKVGIKLFKIFYAGQNIPIPCFLTFCSSDQSLSVFLNFQFLNILVCLLFILYLYKYLYPSEAIHQRNL